MLTSKKIEALIQWGAKPYRISKITGVPENTVRRIWNGETAIGVVKLETAEKLAKYYDAIERDLSQAIATLDVIIYMLDPDRQRLTGNETLYRKLKREPYKVFEQLHKIILEPQYHAKLSDYNHYLVEIGHLISTMDLDIAYNVKLSDMHTYYMHVQRNKMAQQN